MINTPTCPKCGGEMTRNGHTPAGAQRWICWGGTRYTGEGYCHTTTTPAGKAVTRSGKIKGTGAPVFKRKLDNVKRFVVTSAQNATPVHEEFLATLQSYCRHNSAELIVIPIRYKNPTSRWTASQQNAEHWDPLVEPYLYNQRKKLCPNLILLGDIKTIPTAEQPLTGFEGITHGESGILGHSKMQLRCIPTPSHKLPKVMVTTGSITRPNYTDSKAGKKGEFHHVQGAIVVEIRGDKFYMRQINASQDGSFIDWDTEYSLDNVTPAPPAAALVMGDSHFRFMDPGVKDATFGHGGIIDELKPKHLVWHDLLDGYSRNPHHDGNPFIEMAKRFDGQRLHDVEREVRDTVQFLDDVTGEKGCVSVVVSSNHDDFLRRWIVDSDWRQDPENAPFYLETALAITRSVTMGPGGAEHINPFSYWVKKLAKNRAQIDCPTTNESVTIAGIECGMHGHKGPNGARGSLKNLSSLGVKAVIGHSHTPGIHNGTFQTGTSSHLRLEYAEGPSSWLHGHVVIYANGKRSHVFIIDGTYRLK